MEMKLKIINNLLFCIVFISSCTRDVYFTNNCATNITNYDSTNVDWKKLNTYIIQKYHSAKIIGGANNIIIYRALPKDHAIVEEIICEFWKNKQNKLKIK